MDLELLNDIQNVSNKFNIKKISNSEELLIKIRNKFHFSKKKIWMWENSQSVCKVIKYNDQNVFKILNKLLILSKKQTVYITVTDDNPEPWQTYQINAKFVIDFLQSLRYFEYFLFDNSLSWVIFDTHDNDFVIFGEIIKNM